MTHFSDAHNLLRYVRSEGDVAGLRQCQIGAIHAISSHFTVQSQTAVIVLPTGAGKTAVLMLTPYVLCAQRALVITPSRFVREQIVQDFRLLRTLKAAGVLPEDFAPPVITENKSRLETPDQWEQFRKVDVVVSTPNSASPGHKGVVAPPADLFDAVLIDEGHHSPAPTWNALIAAFPGSRCVLFTATPFRRDEKEIKGKYLYTYPIHRAFSDGIYGDMHYIPVEPVGAQTPDEALARATAKIFADDQAAGLQHAVMIRADSVNRANELADVYSKSTTLRLDLVHSNLGQAKVNGVVDRLRQGHLDGVICVNMLGEGFDLPRLKIAALHAPHRSLSVTLQFFGRFARRNGPNLGDARFLAVQSEISTEMEELFSQNEAWGKKIRTIGEARIGAEIATREFLDAFDQPDSSELDSTLGDLSLYSFNLMNHVKVFQVHGEVDLNKGSEILDFITERVWRNSANQTVVILAREEVRPKWTDSTVLNKVEHHVFVVYFDLDTRLLFICATCRDEPVYQAIADALVEGITQPLSLSRINRVLRSIRELGLFNVGMRNRAIGRSAASYRQIAGAAVHQAINKDDGAFYHRGHVFGRGLTAQGKTTIGLSSLSKIWRMEFSRIPELIEWCRALARDLNNPTSFSVGNGLDYLDAGREVTTFPEAPALAVNWHEAIYDEPPFATYEMQSGDRRTVSLLDFEFAVNRKASTNASIAVSLSDGHLTTYLELSVIPFPHVTYIDETQPRISVERGPHRQDIIEYLRILPLRIHFADGSMLEGLQMFGVSEVEAPYDAASLMEAVDWKTERVDIRLEFGSSRHPLRSIHDWLAARLIASDAQIVFYDHRSGECADLLTLKESADQHLTISLYHCKKSGGATAGDRVNDLYDLCGQVTKSVQWRNRLMLLEHVKTRHHSGSRFLKGDWPTFAGILEPQQAYELPLDVFAVQPGLSQGQLSVVQARLLATASRGLTSANCQALRVICSA